MLLLKTAMDSIATLFILLMSINVATPQCTGTELLGPDFFVEWTVAGSFVSFVISADTGRPSAWAALGFTTQTSSPFMVKKLYYK